MTINRVTHPQLISKLFPARIAIVNRAMPTINRQVNYREKWNMIITNGDTSNPQ